MKIGLISDIHADLNLLKMALDILQGQGAEKILCAGDLVDKGLDGDAVVALIRERQIPCVMGNHDRGADWNVNSLLRHFGPDHPQILTKDTLDYLMRLEQMLTFEWLGKKIALAHGAPWSNWEYVYPNTAADTYKMILQEANADIVVLGHTHDPMQIKVGDAWVLNPGSVCDYDIGGSETCALLTLPDCGYRVFDVKTGQPVKHTYREITLD